jgi:hypothetical protein
VLPRGSLSYGDRALISSRMFFQRRWQTCPRCPSGLPSQTGFFGERSSSSGAWEGGQAPRGGGDEPTTSSGRRRLHAFGGRRRVGFDFGVREVEPRINHGLPRLVCFGWSVVPRVLGLGAWDQGPRVASLSAGPALILGFFSVLMILDARTIENRAFGGRRAPS